MIGAEDWRWWRYAARSHDDGRRRRRFRAFFIHFNKGLMNNRRNR